MSTKSRRTIYGSRIRGAKIRADNARLAAKKAIREADRAEAEAWSVRMEGFGGPAQPSPTIGQCLNGGLGWLEVECNRCKARASLPLDAIRRPRDTPVWKLEASLKCRSCRKGRYAPPVHMIKLTEAREITPHKRVTFGRGALRCEASNVVPQRALAIRSAASQSTSPVTGKGAQLACSIFLVTSEMHHCNVWEQA